MTTIPVPFEPHIEHVLEASPPSSRDTIPCPPPEFDGMDVEIIDIDLLRFDDEDDLT